jgi:hypothetical protein
MDLDTVTIEVVPEPSTALGLLVACGLAIGWIRRR